MHPAYSVPPLLTCLGMLGLGVFVVWQRPKERLNQLIGLLAWSVAQWLFGYGLVYCTRDSHKALQYARFAYMGAVFIPTLFVNIMAEFLKLRRRAFVAAAYGLSFVFLYVSQLNAFMPEVHTFFWGYYPKAGPIYWTFLVFFYGSFGLCIYKLSKAYFQIRGTPEAASIHGQRLKLVFWANCVASLSFTDFLPKFGIEVYPCAYLAAAGWVLLMGYAVLKYQLMNIHVVIKKTILYSSVSAGLAAAYVGVITLLARFTENYQAPDLAPANILRSIQGVLQASFSQWSLGTAFLSFALGAFVWFKGSKQALHRLWTLFCLTVGWWSLGIGMMTTAQTFEQAYWWQMVCVYAGAIMIPIVFLHFTMLVTEWHQPRVLLVGYTLALGLEIMNALGKLVSLRRCPPFSYYTLPCHAYHYFTFYFFLLAIYSHVLLYHRMATAGERSRNQLKFIFFGTAIGFCGGSTTFFYTYGIPVFPYGSYLVPIYVIAISYAIVKHHLMDVMVVIRKTLVYSLVSAALASIYVGTITLLAHLLEGRHGSSPAVSSALAAIFITLLFNPLRNRLQQLIDAKFERSRLVGGDQLMQLSAEVIGHENLEKVMQSVGKILEETVRPALWALYLRPADNQEFVKMASSNAIHLTPRVPLTNSWTNQILQGTVPSGFWAEAGLSLAIPLMSGQTLLGCLLLGAKRSEEPYTDEDLVLLRLIANQAAIAFERPQMAQQISNAFVHEIKMPLAKISVPAELTFMDMDDLERGQRSPRDIAPAIRKRMKFIMDQAALASQRIDAVREISGPAEAVWAAVDGRRLIEKCLDQLSVTLNQAHVAVEVECPREPLAFPVKEAQLEIVLLNLMKNAIEAMAANPEGTPRRLAVYVEASAQDVTLRVRDTGPGVKPADAPLLFQARYSTKGSQGLGMGLYLSRQIARAAGGTLELTSSETGRTEFTLHFSRNGTT